MLSEISQREKDIYLCSHLYVQSKTTKATKLIKEEIPFVVDWRREWEEGELNESGQEEQASSYQRTKH